jgi:hypothetical protein
MSLTYGIEHDVLTVKTVGVVDFAEGFAVFQRGLQAYSECAPALPRILFDLVESEENRTADELKNIAIMVGERFPGARIAIVVRSDLLYGLSRMFAVFVEPKVSAIKIFRDLPTAQRWLLSTN